MNDMIILGVAASAKSLAEQNATAIEALKGGMKYKGAVEDYAHLPATGVKVGDVYTTLDDGCEYVWGNVGGTNQWIKLGTDAVEELTEAEVDAAVGAELITVTVTNGTATGDTAIAGTATVTIVPNEGYILPQSVTVANATYTYNAETGVISLSEPTDTVTISAECEALYKKCTVAGLGSIDPTSVTFTKDAGFTKAGLGIEDVTLGTDVFVKIPTMYRKIETITDNQITSFTISNGKLDNDYQPYSCFVDESGNELPYILIGKYWNTEDNGCVSTTEASSAYLTTENGRTYARAKGTGYQLYDWQMQKLWQDLIICFKETVNTNAGAAWTYDELGIYWATSSGWIDGVIGYYEQWSICSKPSKYASLSSTSDPIPSDYGNSHGRPTNGNLDISKLGYDANNPFFNYPRAVANDSNYATSYCDEFLYNGGKYPIYSFVGGTQKKFGAFHTGCGASWTDTRGVRLCYRPIA